MSKAALISSDSSTDGDLLSAASNRSLTAFLVAVSVESTARWADFSGRCSENPRRWRQSCYNARRSKILPIVMSSWLVKKSKCPRCRRRAALTEVWRWPTPNIIVNFPSRKWELGMPSDYRAEEVAAFIRPEYLIYSHTNGRLLECFRNLVLWLYSEFVQGLSSFTTTLAPSPSKPRRIKLNRTIKDVYINPGVPAAAERTTSYFPAHSQDHKKM